MDLSSIPQWAVPVEPVSEAQIVKTYTADVVILGAGYSGTAAARAAAEAGAKVLVVEQQQEKSFQCFGAHVRLSELGVYEEAGRTGGGPGGYHRRLAAPESKPGKPRPGAAVRLQFRLHLRLVH